jgi:hypothetical protein
MKDFSSSSPKKGVICAPKHRKKMPKVGELEKIFPRGP